MAEQEAAISLSAPLHDRRCITHSAMKAEARPIVLEERMARAGMAIHYILSNPDATAIATQSRPVWPRDELADGILAMAALSYRRLFLRPSIVIY